MNVLRQEIRTGLVVIVSLAVLLLVLLYLGAPGVFIPQKRYYIYVENAAGLKQGADVAVAGRKIGQVIQLFSPVAVDERPEKRLETMVEVRVNASAKIYRQTKVQITSSSLLGEYFIDFTSGNEESGEAPPKTAFVAAPPNSISDAIPKILEKLDPIVAQATATLQVLQKTADNINRLTSPDGELQLAVTEFRKVGTNLKETTGPDGALHQTLENVNKLTADDGKLGQTLENLRELTGPESPLARTLQNAEKFTGDLEHNEDLKLTLANSRRATEQLSSTLTELRFKFAGVATNLEQATDTLKRQPWRLIWPSTKKYAEAPTPVVRGTVKIDEKPPKKTEVEVKVGAAKPRAPRQ